MYYDSINLQYMEEKMKRMIKAIFIILISTIMILEIPVYSNAFSFGGLMNDANSFLAAGSGSSQNLGGIFNSISNILLTIALGVTLISGVVMAINFAIQSVEEKAKIKESMVPWVIGIFVSFGAYGIWRITLEILS